jgi:hypothetical protein
MNTTTPNTNEEPPPPPAHDDPTEALLEQTRVDLVARFSAKRDARDAAARALSQRPDDKKLAAAFDDADRDLNRVVASLGIATTDLEGYREKKRLSAIAEKRAAFERAKAEAMPSADVEAFVERHAPNVIGMLLAAASFDEEIDRMHVAAAQARHRALDLGPEIGERVTSEHGHPLIRVLEIDTVRAALRERIENICRDRGLRDLHFPEWLAHFM